VGALTYRRAPFDLARLLAQSVDAFRERLGARGIVAETAAAARPLRVVGDSDRLGQVFHNILENAARYADAGARVRARCRRDGPFVEAVIEDSGPGVPDEYLDKLFDRFYRLEGSRNRATGGSGLGLAICRGIIAAHDGTLVAARSPLGGLALTLRLPAAAATGAAKP
jgi:two-component system sensor histidine kinase BaeS